VHRYAEVAVSSLKEALLFNFTGVIVALGVLLLYRVPLTDSFGFIILIESTGLMLVGGALGVAGQATSRKLTEMLTRRKVDPKTIQLSDLKAELYALTGVLLFAEGALMAVLLF
jgi:hypothetical protein